VIYLDTHVLVRLYQGDTESSRILCGAKSNITTCWSAGRVLELEYLHEIGRLQRTH